MIPTPIGVMIKISVSAKIDLGPRTTYDSAVGNLYYYGK